MAPITALSVHRAMGAMISVVADGRRLFLQPLPQAAIGGHATADA